MATVGQLVFDGLAMGLVYVILCVGMVLVTSVNKILFLTYGMFYTVGAYGTWYLFDRAGLPYPAAAALAAVAAGVLRVICQVLIFQRLQYSKGGFLATLIGSLALLLILNQAILMLFGTVPRSVPQVFAGSLRACGVNLSLEKVMMIVIGIIITGALFFIVMRTKWGRAMRTAAFSPDVATLHGISAKRVYVLTLGMACLIAGLAGALLAPAYGVTKDMGNQIIWTVMLMMMVGGMDSLFGAVLGGIVIGEALSFGLYYIGTITQILVFLIIGIILYFKPNGLLGRGVDIGI